MLVYPIENFTCSRSLTCASTQYTSALNDLGVILNALPVIVANTSSLLVIIEPYEPVVLSAPLSDKSVNKLPDNIRFISLLTSCMLDFCIRSFSYCSRESMQPSHVVGWYLVVFDFTCQFSSVLMKFLRV